MAQFTSEEFRRMYQTMLDRISGARGRYIIKTNSTDDWIIITRRAVTGIAVWHQFKHNAVELTLDGERRDIVGGILPPDAEDRSDGNISFRQYRWKVQAIDVTRPPFDQDGVIEAIERAVWAFEWVAQNKVPKLL